MAQKVNPIALRLQKTNLNFDSCWYNNSNYVNLLMADIKIQNYIDSILKKVKFSSARFLIQNLHNKVKINVFFCNQSQKDMSRFLRVKTFKKLNKPDKNFFTNKNLLIKTKQNKIYNYLNKNFSKETSLFKNIHNTKKLINNSKVTQLLKKSKYLCFLSKQKNKSLLFKDKEKNQYSSNLNLPIHENRVSSLSLSLKNENHEYKLFDQESLFYTFLEKNNQDILYPKVNFKIKKEKNKIYTKEKQVYTYSPKASASFFPAKRDTKYLPAKNRCSFFSSKVKQVKLGKEKFYFEKYSNAIEKLNEISIKYFIIKFFTFTSSKSKKQKNFLKNKQPSYNLNCVFKEINDSLFLPFFFKKNFLVSLLIHKIWNSYNTSLFVTKNNWKYLNKESQNTQNSLQNQKVNLKYLAPKYYKASEYKCRSFFNFNNYVIRHHSFLNTFFSIFKTSFTSTSTSTSTSSRSQKKGNLSLLSLKEKDTKYLAFQKNSKVKKSNKLIQLSCLKRKLNFPFTIFTYLSKNKKTLHKKKENSKFPKLFPKTLNFILNDAYYYKAKSFAGVSLMFKQHEIQKPNYIFYNDKAKSFVSKHVFKNKSFSKSKNKQTTRFPFFKNKKGKQIQSNKIFFPLPLKTCLVQSPVYKQHMECIIHENFKRCVSLQFFKNTNMFQSALFLIDQIIYYLQKKVRFFKLKNFILRKLVEQKSLKIKGIRIMCSGRVGGKSKKAQKAKIQNIKYGETSLHVFSYKIDFQAKTAFTSFGAVGIKVWICYA